MSNTTEARETAGPAAERPGGAPDEPQSQQMPGTVIPRWAVHRRMYDWVLSLAHTRHATWGLFLLSFAESSFFPIPPDVLQIALTLERRLKAWWYALVSTAGSVAGGLAGYLIGWGFWEALSPYFFRHVFTEAQFEKVRGLYEAWGFWIVFVAAFTPIPYKVFTICSGVMGIPLAPFLFGSAIGRGGRFFLVAALLYKFGPPIKAFIEKYFNLLTLVGGLVLAAAFIVYKAL